MANGFKYDAFISYRHADLDKFVAENLHRKLESYKVSKKVISNGRTRRSKIERVFRDKDELPITNNLEDPIIQALQQSEYLLVICTPRLKESIWCKKEIETFINIHGRDKIFAVLAEGEPHESFPEEILYRDEQVQYPDGTIETRLVPAEPLAADVRGKNKKEILKAMDVEVLRLLAPMLGVDFDDLKQRHRERKFKKIISATVAAAVVCLGIGIASTITALHISKQKKQIEAQSVEIQNQAGKIASQSDAIQAQNEQLLNIQAKNLAEKSFDLLEEGDRVGAISIAKEALTISNGIEMPYTAEAHYALAESLHVYDSGNMYKPDVQYTTSGNIVSYDISPGQNKLVLIDATGCISIWDTETDMCIDTLENAMKVGMEVDDFGFVDDNIFIYLDVDGAVCKYDVNEKRVVAKKTYDTDMPRGIKVEKNGSHIAVLYGYNIDLLDVGTMESMVSFQAEENREMLNKMFFAEGKYFFYSDSLVTSGEELSENDVDGLTKLHIIDMDAKREITSVEIQCDNVEGLRVKGENVYFSAVSTDYRNSNIYSVIMKYDLSKTELLWETPVDGVLAETIVFPGTPEGQRMMVLSSLQAFFIDINTGEIVDMKALTSNPVGYGAYTNSDKFMIFTADFYYFEYLVQFEELLGIEYLFERNNSIISDFAPLGNGFIMIAEGSNTATYYSLSCNPELSPYEGTYVEKEYNTEEDVTVIADELQLKKKALVNTIFYNEDCSIMFISYEDESLEIYDNNSKELLATLDEAGKDIFRCYGTDDEGNTYVGSIFYGYILNAEYKMVGRIENLLDVDFELGVFVVGDYKEQHQLPMYSIEELLEMAE